MSEPPLHRPTAPAGGGGRGGGSKVRALFLVFTVWVIYSYSLGGLVMGIGTMANTLNVTFPFVH